MTAAEWDSEGDPGRLLRLLREAARPHAASPRKLRLLACAWVRSVWPLLADGASRDAVALAERLADGGVTRREVAAGEARSRSGRAAKGDEAALAARKTLLAGAADAAEGALWCVRRAMARQYEALAPGGGWVAYDDHCKGALRALLGDVLGFPLAGRRGPAPGWLTGEVARLATAAYAERVSADGGLDPARLAVLSDTLKEAGCDDAGLPSHLRSPAAHVRGCWCLDLVLGKA